MTLNTKMGFMIFWRFRAAAQVYIIYKVAYSRIKTFSLIAGIMTTKL